MTALRLGTRRSALARTQSETVAADLRAATGREVELVEVTTHGDTSSAPLAQIGGTGVFTSALRDALLTGRVDLAVHSLKDLPTAPADGLALAAVPARQDPRDVLVARDGLTVDTLPSGSRVGTGSPRRAAQLRALRQDVDVCDVRGNVDTRLRAVADGTLDAVVLARAGLLRLGRAEEATQVLDPQQMLPAPGQGALALECRADDAETFAACQALDDVTTRACTDAERAVLAGLEAGCSAPVGALAVAAQGVLDLRALVAAPDGTRVLRHDVSGPADAAAELGRSLAAALLARGAAELVPDHPPPTPPPDLTPPSDQTQTLATGSRGAAQESDS